MTNRQKVSDAALRIPYLEKRLIERIYRDGEPADDVANDMQMTMSEARKCLGRAVREIANRTGIDEEIVEELVCFI